MLSCVTNIAWLYLPEMFIFFSMRWKPARVAVNPLFLPPSLRLRPEQSINFSASSSRSTETPLYYSQRSFPQTSLFTTCCLRTRSLGENLTRESQVSHNTCYRVSDDHICSISLAYPTTKTNISWAVRSTTKDAPKRNTRTNTPITAAIFSRPRLARNRIHTGARTNPTARNAAESLESISNRNVDKWTTVGPSGVSFSSSPPSKPWKLRQCSDLE
jgi:hypothetical protein